MPDDYVEYMLTGEVVLLGAKLYIIFLERD